MSILNENVSVTDIGPSAAMKQSSLPFAEAASPYKSIVIGADDPINHPNPLKIIAMRASRMLRSNFDALMAGTKTLVHGRGSRPEQGHTPL